MGQAVKGTKKNLTVCHHGWSRPRQDEVLQMVAVKMHLIMLAWKDGIAYRRGLATLEVNNKDILKLQSTNPERRRFLLRLIGNVNASHSLSGSSTISRMVTFSPFNPFEHA